MDIIALLPKLEKYAYKFSRNPDTVADLVQDTAECLLRTEATFRGEANLNTWSYRIMTNIFLMGKRAAKSRPGDAPSDVEDYGMPELTVPPNQDGRVLLGEVVSLIGAYPEETRDAVAGIAAGEKFREIAQRQGRKCVTVKTRVCRLRKELAL
jgi:RNA polymerase sigma-70 factor (ECF subfamily)